MAKEAGGGSRPNRAAERRTGKSVSVGFSCGFETVLAPCANRNAKIGDTAGSATAANVRAGACAQTAANRRAAICAQANANRRAAIRAQTAPRTCAGTGTAPAASGYAGIRVQTGARAGRIACVATASEAAEGRPVRPVRRVV